MKKIKKTTLHGVKSNSTKAMFSELRKRGFKVHLEKGSNGTFKIITLINGTHFVLSCVDGKEPKYTKKHSRGDREWAVFDKIDDLMDFSNIKRESKPTEKQTSFFNSLIKELCVMYDEKVTIKVPQSVGDMCSAIRDALWLKQVDPNDNGNDEFYNSFYSDHIKLKRTHRMSDMK